MTGRTLLVDCVWMWGQVWVLVIVLVIVLAIVLGSSLCSDGVVLVIWSGDWVGDCFGDWVAWSVGACLTNRTHLLLLTVEKAGILLTFEHVVSSERPVGGAQAKQRV